MFYENVKELCFLHRTNITSLMRELGMSTAMPTSWKRGAIPKADTIQKIADHFGVTTDSLLRDNSHYVDNVIKEAANSIVAQGNTGTTVINEQKEKLSDMESELLRIFRSLDMRSKNKVMSYMYELEDQAKEVK